MQKLSILIVLFMSLTAVALTAQSDWEIVKDKEDLKVYTRKQEGSIFKEVKMDAQIQTSLSEIVSALEKVESQGDWVETTKETRILENNGPGNFVFYQSTDMPYPAKDRDVVLQYTRRQDPSTKKVFIDFQSVTGKLPDDKKHVRMPELHSSYVLTPSADGMITVQYVLKVDIGGKLPKWVINMAITEGPTDAMESLFAALKAGKYAGAVVEGVINN